jgi:hypothetical protein
MDYACGATIGLLWIEYTFRLAFILHFCIRLFLVDLHKAAIGVYMFQLWLCSRSSVLAGDFASFDILGIRWRASVYSAISYRFLRCSWVSSSNMPKFFCCVHLSRLQLLLSTPDIILGLQDPNVEIPAFGCHNSWIRCALSARLAWWPGSSFHSGFPCVKAFCPICMTLQRCSANHLVGRPVHIVLEQSGCVAGCRQDLAALCSRLDYNQSSKMLPFHFFLSRSLT